MSKLLSDNDFETAAFILECEVAAIRAVAEVESAGAGFLDNGLAKILFEGHIFYKYTSGAYAATNPTICYPRWTTKFYKGGAAEYDRLREAEALNRTAARMSASYGKFQIMGFNYSVCGFNSVEDFYNAMQNSEADQLNAFCEFIKSNNLIPALQNRNWAQFARAYNGPEYARNAYDTKLAAAYKKYAAMA
jgi:hypothetical protein